MKHKLFTLLFAVIASLGTVFAQSGTCGDNLTWNLSNGVLIISGTGEMKDYMTSYPAPWYSYRTSVQYVVIGNGVTSIGNNAFYNCDSLTSVTIPNSVTSIGISAFSGCHSLLSLTIPNSVTSIKRNAFYTVPNIIYNGTVTGSPWGARSMNGYVDNYLVYTDASKTKLLACSAAATIVTIPNSVASIGEYAFYRCRSLISITIPNGVPAIEERTFYGCNRLESVILPNTISTIGVHAFDGCNSLSSINIPNTVTSIGEGTFSFCRGLTSVMIPNSVTSIGDAAFYYCSSLTSVTIPNSVTSIGERAFASCSSMISIDIADSNPNYCSVEGVIFNKEKSTLIQYPGGKQGDYIIPTSVTSIENSAFRDCSGLTSVTIPNSVIGIGSYAFSGCSGLTSVSLPNSVTSIGSRAFEGCSSLTSVSIGNSVTSIGERAFASCSSLTSVTIPDGVTNIGSGAFFGCTGLASVTIPNSVTSIESYAFSQCTGLTSITNKALIPQAIVSSVFSSSILSQCVLYVPKGSLTLYQNAPIWNTFAHIVPIELTSGTCGPNLTWNLTDGILTISGTGEMTDFSYPDYGPWYSLSSSITSVVINDGVTSIGDYAFYSCANLTSVMIGNSVTSIGGKAFSSCSSLTSVTIPNSVEIIGGEAFSSCSSLTSVTIGNSVTSIGYEAFRHCINLVSINVENGNQNFSSEDGVLLNKQKTTIIKYPQGRQGAYTIPNSVTEIGDLAFLSCDGLTSVIISNSVTRIGVSAFQYCKNLVSVTLPNSVTSIGNSAFSGCSSLTSVSIGNSVTSIGSSAFSGCSSLTSVIIPNSVTSIGYDAFYRCYSLASVSIGNSVTSIGSSAFFECISLTSVTIPISVTSIGDYAFEQCSSLTNIYLNSTTPPTIRSSTFYKIPTNAIVHVLFGGISAYKNSSYWKDLNIQGPSINQEIMPLSTSCSIRYDVDGVELQSVGISGGEQQPGNVLEYIDLEPNSEYKDVPVVLTSNTGETETVNVSFTTTALELTTKPSKAVSATTAILLAETNMSDAEVSCGFEYKRNDAPADMAGTKVFCPVANGQMAGRLKNLKDDVYYKYRAFYQSAAGNMYYGDWQYIFTGDVAVEFDPILYTYGATVVKETEATICGYALAGSEDFTEQGFEYWAETRANGGTNAPRRMPAALNEHFFVQASGISLRVTLTDLDAGTVYKYRVYGKVGDQYYYGSEQAFTTTGTYTPPTYTITFANWDGATLQSSQVEEGTLPIYTGATPERPEDEQYIYTFNGWSPAVVAATADATYTATYTATPKSQGIEDVQGNNVQCTKVVRDGRIFILRGEKVYNAQGALVK